MNSRCVVMIPCYNEEVTIEKVIHDARTFLPEAEIFVFDNNSTDRTAQIAEGAGAAVIREKRHGKGFVVQTMFSRIEADVYVMVDGDDTYDLRTTARNGCGNRTRSGGYGCRQQTGQLR